MAVRQVKPRVWGFCYLFHLWKLNHRLNAALDKLQQLTGRPKLEIRSSCLSTACLSYWNLLSPALLLATKFLLLNTTFYKVCSSVCSGFVFLNDYKELFFMLGSQERNYLLYAGSDILKKRYPFSNSRPLLKCIIVCFVWYINTNCVWVFSM